MNKYRDIVGRINYVLFLVAVATLPLPQVFIRYALVIWLVAWILELRFLDKSQILNHKSQIKQSLPLCLFALWYAWRGLSGLWSPDHRAWSFMMERYMTFGLLVPVALWGVNDYYNWKTAGKVLAISCAASVLFYIACITMFVLRPDWVQYFHYGDWSFKYHSWIQCFVENGSFIKHRLFWCSTQLLGVIAAFQVWRNKPQIYIPLSLVMLSAIPLTGSRQTILTLAAVIVIALIYILPKKHRAAYGIGIILLGVLLSGTLLALHPRMHDLDFRLIHSAEDFSDNREVRLNIWGFALSNPEDYFWSGLGGGQSVNYLVAKYKAAEAYYYANMRFHAHNQYLEELMELGIFGMLFFITIWLSIVFCAKGEGRKTAVLFTAIFMLNMLTDCMWGKFDGIALWAIGMLYIFLQSDTHHLVDNRIDSQTGC